MTETQQNSALTETIKQLRDLVNNLLVVLSQKEKQIIEERFSLNGNPRSTLEKIGKEFGVTRERVRQIEKNALRKLQRNVANTKLSILNQHGNTLLQKYDGVCLEEKIVADILALVSGNADGSAVKLSLNLDPNLEKIHNTIHYYPYWKFKIISQKDIQNVCEKAILYLGKKSDVISPDEIVQHLSGLFEKKMTKQFVLSCLELDRRIKITKAGIGLATWRHINPKTLRDKILFVLKVATKPLHFVDISNRITEMNFDKKVVNVQAVHNELIRYPQFVLIGRGIYALKDWGYEDGTVSDIITDILKKEGPLDRDKIIEKVLKQRQVKRITILLNLKNKPIYKKEGEMYMVKK